MTQLSPGALAGLVEKVRELLPEVTPGEWTTDPDDRPDMEWNWHVVQATEPNRRIAFMANSPRAEENAALIALAPTMAAAILALEAQATALFGAIAHGDEEHRAWLKQAIADHFTGKPIAAPVGLGNKDRATRAEAVLREERDELRCALEVHRTMWSEVGHAMAGGPDWYTKGESGLRGQVRMWLTFADEAYTTLARSLTAPVEKK